jgi:hypothetical protein
MEYIPGVIAYFMGGFSIWATKILVWRIANHWSKIWVGDIVQAESQVISLTVVITSLIIFGFAVFIFSICNHINYKNTEKGFAANVAGGIGFAAAIGQELWLNDIVSNLPFTS